MGAKYGRYCVFLMFVRTGSHAQGCLEIKRFGAERRGPGEKIDCQGYSVVEECTR